MPSGLLRNRDFLKLWAGQTISEIGSRISREGLPMTAVLILHASPFEMGLLAAAGGITALVAGPAAGVIVDRWRRRPMLIAADVLRGLLLALVPVAAFAGKLSMALLLAVATLVGIFTVFFDVAYQSFVPSLVEDKQLVEANGKLAVSMSTAEVIGPGLTGVLVQWMTAPGAILFDAISFMVSAMSIAWIQREKEVVRATHDRSALADAISGLRYVIRHPVLRPLALRMAATSLCFGPFSTLYILFAVETLGLKPAVLGMVIAVGGLTSLAGALAAQWIGSKWHVGRVLIGASTCLGLALSLVPAAGGDWKTAAVILALAQVGDFFFPIYNVLELSLRQSIAEPEYLGRVNACSQMLLKGMWPIGALIGGWLGAEIGIRPTLLLAGAGVIASTLILVLSPVRKLRSFS